MNKFEDRFDEFFQNSKHYKKGLEELKEFLMAEKEPTGMVITYLKSEDKAIGIVGGYKDFKVKEKKDVVNALALVAEQIINDLK